jgi:hypothetical protein
MASNFSLRRPIGVARGANVFMTPEFQRAVFGVSTDVDLLSSSSATTLMAAYAPQRGSQRVYGAYGKARPDVPLANYRTQGRPRASLASYRARPSRPLLARY